LFVDIRGFTDMVSATPPDEIITLLTEYQARLLPPIHDHGGTSEKFLGDGMVAAFGAVVENDRCVADALEAVDDILVSVDQWNAARRAEGRRSIEIGVALTAGRVVFGAVGGGSRLEYAVVGHPVNLAAKIEKLNKDEGSRALCTVEAYQAAVSQGYRTAAPPDQLTRRDVPGVSGPLDLVVLAR
jgi:adenylate cyclase